MKNMWIELHGRRQSPASAASSRLPIKPMNRCHGELAIATAATTVLPADVVRRKLRCVEDMTAILPGDSRRRRLRR